jgi:hypothetical protein
MTDTQIEIVGKVFVVVRGMRRCLICNSLFTRKGAGEHAGIACFPNQLGSETRADEC